MNLRKFITIFFLALFLLPTYIAYAQNANTGFVKGNIWYSKDPFEEGDKIKIYTVVFNPDQKELSGTVVFFDNTVFLGKENFTVPAQGIKDISVDWTATVGDHIIFGKIENAKFLISSGKYQEVYLAENETEKSSRTITKKVNSTSSSTSPNSLDVVSKISSDSLLNIKDNIGKLIGNSTSNLIAKPIITSTNAIDKFRSDMGILARNKKTDVNNEIKSLNEMKKSDDKNSKIIKPFKYIELFFVSIISIIFNNRVIFYLVFIAIILFFLRYLWYLIF